MKIKKIYISNYKNLDDCVVEPDGIHALTGCNGSGKSNLLEVPQFISSFISGSDNKRGHLLCSGIFPGLGSWFPIVHRPEDTRPFQFSIDCLLKVNDEDWDVSYSLEFERQEFEGSYKQSCSRVASESLYIKEVGKTGRMKCIIQRGADGGTVVNYEKDTRKKIKFKTKHDMSTLQSLEVREADEFVNSFPVTSEFRRALLSFVVLKLNPEEIVNHSSDSTMISSQASHSLKYVPLYSQINEIKQNKSVWREYTMWLKRLCNIDRIDPQEHKIEGADGDKSKSINLVMISQQNQFLLPYELSTGCAMLLGLITAIFSIVSRSSAILIEEPESYLHPKAINDLMKLLRSVSQTSTIIVTTHSPVILNSLQPEEVTLMIPSKGAFFTSRKVSQLAEATDAISRGYVSFGDLLQTNFQTD